MLTKRYGNTRRQKCRAKGSRKEAKIKGFLYRDTTNVEPEIPEPGYTGNNRSHRSSNNRFMETFKSHTGKTFNRLTATESCTFNSTHNMESAAV
jgi:hypothetical protein